MLGRYRSLDIINALCEDLELNYVDHSNTAAHPVRSSRIRPLIFMKSLH